MERNGQMSFFDLMYDEYHFKSNISLIELFAGYGSQALSLKYLQEDGLLKQGFRHLKISEWAIPSILAYYDLHKGEKGIKEKQLNNIIHWKSQQNPLDKVSGKNTICPTITTRVAESCDGGISASMIVVSDKFEDTTNVRKEIIKLGNYSKSNHNATNILSPLGSAQTVMECHGSIQAVAIPIKNATKKGYLLAAEEEDGIDISTRMESHRGTVQKGLAQTLKTQCEVGVIQKKPIDESELLGGLEDYGIRKLTPRECFRLMGVRDYDIDKLEHKFTDQQKWHLAGDSIVVNVLYHIFKQMI